ncbi:MAG: hypothetical protein P8011_04825 [Acidihalobacter sp.]|jgi:hypothetical protein|uniref:hypothetical protein n=1 Tax=Acidihalobacter sp. TaxID=1872108 RepID=UPI00307EFB95
MNEQLRILLNEALQKQKACEKIAAEATPLQPDEIIERLRTLERKSWSESPLEPENRPLEYRFLLSLLNEPAILESRYTANEHVFLKGLVAQRYIEVLEQIDDAATLMELAGHCHPQLRPFAVSRFQLVLPHALQDLTPTTIPTWFVRLLRQPTEMLDFLSVESCHQLTTKIESLLAVI